MNPLSIALMKSENWPPPRFSDWVRFIANRARPTKPSLNTTASCAISPTSLLIYSGNLFPQWRGSGFIGTLTGKGLVRVTLNSDRAAKADDWDMGARIRFVGQGPEGAIYLLEDGPGGRLLRLEPKAR